MKAREKKQRLTEATAHYLRQIGRKAQKGEEPNDRRFDHKLDEKLKRMRPETSMLFFVTKMARAAARSHHPSKSTADNDHFLSFAD